MKPAKVSTNRDSLLIMHKKTFILSIHIQKIKDIKEQVPNKLVCAAQKE
jgi:hypothetical protein